MTNKVVAQVLASAETRPFTTLELANIRAVAQAEIDAENYRAAVEAEKVRIRARHNFWRWLRSLFPVYIHITLERPRS